MGNNLAIWYIQTKYPAGYVRFLAENAGSMQEFHKSAIKEILGIEHVSDAALKWDTSLHFGIRRDRYFFRNYEDSSNVIVQNYSVFGEDGFGPLRNTNNQLIALGPLLRVREELGNNILRLSWTSYQPISLLWDYSFWGGEKKFAEFANLKHNARIPAFDFSLCLPPLWYADWKNFLANMYKSGINGHERDAMIVKLLPIFCNKNVHIPFRTLTVEEVVKFAGLSGHFDSIKANKPLLTERNIRDYCGNSFHPALIQAALGSKQNLLKWRSSLNQNGEPQTVVTPGRARLVFHKVMEEVKNITANTQNLNYLKQVVFDPMPDLKITQLPVLSDAELPVVSSQSQLPQTANKAILLGQKYDRAHAGPFSEATKHIIRQCKFPIDICELPFYGYGVHDRNDVVKFFLGVNGTRWHRLVSKENMTSLTALQTRFATSGNGLQKLLVDIINELCKMRLSTLVILVLDFQEGSKVLTFGGVEPQWVTYCVWNPIRKFFYLDMVAWNVYGPVPGKWDINLTSTHVVLDYKPQIYSILFPIIVHSKRKHCLFSGHGAIRLCDECQFCTREADIEAYWCVYRAIAVIDDKHNFQILQTESPITPQGLLVWRVLVVSAQHVSQIPTPIEQNFAVQQNPRHLDLTLLQQEVNCTVQGSRFQRFDNFEDAWYHVVVAYVWNLPTLQT